MIRCRTLRPTATGETPAPATSHRRRNRDHDRGPATHGTQAQPVRAGSDAARPTRSEPPSAQKLLVIIVSDADADALVRALVTDGLAATKIGSTGGFLRRGNTTLLVGVPADGVEGVLDLVGRLCPSRTELLTLGALPLAGEAAFMTEPVEVRVGGAVVFVLNVERFDRL